MTRSIKFKNGYITFQTALFNIRHPSFCEGPSAFVLQADLHLYFGSCFPTGPGFFTKPK